MNPKHCIALATLACLAAVPARAATVDAKSFVAKAGASDLYEREASQLVLGSSDPTVKAFAGQMIKDHTASTEKIKSAAAKAHLTVGPPSLAPEQAAMIARLRKSTGAARDHLYITQQHQAHQQALTLMKGYAATGDSPPLKAAAAEIVPVVQHHVDMLEHGHK